jgi:photosystem II stability/assembly factor-like uncharacterized protein
LKRRTATLGASIALGVLALQSALAVSVVYKSVDGGASWSPSYNGMIGPPEFLAVDPGNSANLYALAGGGGLYKSTDAGAILFGVRGFFGTLAISPSKPSTLYADATSPRSDGIMRSADGGLTWSTVSDRAPFRLLAIDPRNPDTVYGSTGGDGSGQSGSGLGGLYDGLYKSTDGGVTWNALLAGRGTGIQALNITAPTYSAYPVSGAVVGADVASVPFIGLSWSCHQLKGSEHLARELGADRARPAPSV